MARDAGEVIGWLISLAGDSLMLCAYVDDSGNSQLPVFVLAGFVSTPSSWEAFSDEWRSVLNLTPSVECFKGSEAFNLNGSFHGWTEADRDVRVLMLVEVIKRHTVAGFVTQVPYDAGQWILAPSRSGKRFSVVQLLNFISLVGILQTGSFGEPNQKIQLVLDRSIFKGLAKKVFKHSGVFDGFAKKTGTTPRNNLQWPPEEQDDLVALPLQAADMFAWIWRERTQRLCSNQPESPVVHRMLTATHPLPIRSEFLGDEEIQRLAAGVQRAAIEKWDQAVVNIEVTYQI